MEPLRFLAPQTFETGFAVRVAGDTVGLAPHLLGFFVSFFWTIFFLGLRPRRPGGPCIHYVFLIGFTIGATVVHAVQDRFFQTGPFWPAAWLSGLFAGAGIAVYLFAPAAAFFGRPHIVPEPVGFFHIAGIPLVLGTMAFGVESGIVGALLLGSALLGFWAALLLILVGCFSFLSVPRRSVLAFAALWVLPIHLGLALLPKLVDTARSWTDGMAL